MDTDEIPTIEIYKGVPLEGGQSDGRLVLVRREIDVVLAMTDAGELAGWAADPRHSPESRLLACAMCESMWAVASEKRANRPLHASVAGLGSRRWRDPSHFCSLLDDNAAAVPREEFLADE
jgi:hypothetical protein